MPGGGLLLDNLLRSGQAFIVCIYYAYTMHVLFL